MVRTPGLALILLGLWALLTTVGVLLTCVIVAYVMFRPRPPEVYV